MPVLKKAKTGSEEVDEFMKGVNHSLKKGMVTLRELILDSDKGITEHIKWKAPSFCFRDDDRITFNLHKGECIMIIFHRGAKVKDTKGKGHLFEDSTGLLEWLAYDRAVMKLYDMEEINSKKSDIRKVVKQWISHTKE